MTAIEMISTTISLFGMALVARHETRMAGFGVCMGGNLAWLYCGLNPWHLSTIVLFSGYLVCNVVGFHDELIKWIRLRQFKIQFNKQHK